MAIIAGAAVFQLMFWTRPELWGVLFTHLAMNNFMIAEGEWWRMFTVVLLHAGLMHVAFNSLLLYQLGTALERQIGSVRLFMAFLVSAAWGSAWAFLLGDPGDIGVGMSGAVFGVVGIWLASGLRHRHTRQGRYVLDQMRGLIVLNAVVPFVLPQVSWQAHLGGLVGGFLLGQTWAKTRGERAVAAHMVIALGLMALAVAATRF